jgi:hypothetical protein
VGPFVVLCAFVSLRLLPANLAQPMEVRARFFMAGGISNGAARGPRAFLIPDTPELDEPPSHEGQWFAGLTGTLMSIRSSSEQAKGAYSVFESIAAPRRGPPLHFYRDTDTVFQPLDAPLRLECDGEELEVPARRRVAIPRGVHQAWRNDTEKPIRFLTTFIPGDIETLFPQMGGLSTQELDELMSRYGVFIVGPGIGEDLLNNWPRRELLGVR